MSARNAQKNASVKFDGVIARRWFATQKEADQSGTSKPFVWVGIDKEAGEVLPSAGAFLKKIDDVTILFTDSFAVPIISGNWIAVVNDGTVPDINVYTHDEFLTKFSVL